MRGDEGRGERDFKTRACLSKILALGCGRLCVDCAQPVACHPFLKGEKSYTRAGWTQNDQVAGAPNEPLSASDERLDGWAGRDS